MTRNNKSHSDNSSSHKHHHNARKNRKCSKDTDSDSCSDSSEYDSESSSEKSNTKTSKMSKGKLQKTIASLYPSKYMKKRAKNTEKYENKQKKKLKSNKNKNKKKRIIESETETDDSDYETDDDEPEYDDNESDDNESDEDESDDDESDEDESDDDESNEDESDDDIQYGSKKKSKKTNSDIINVLLGMGLMVDANSSIEYVDEDKDTECNSDDEHTFMKETYMKNQSKNKHSTTSLSTLNSAPTSPKKCKVEIVEDNVEIQYTELAETKQNLLEQLKTKPTNKILINAIKECKKSINKLVKRSRNKNAKLYHKLINNDNKTETNEIDYFKKKLSNKEQQRITAELTEINECINIDKPYRISLLNANIPPKFKAIAMQKLNILRTMEPGDSEYYKIKQWVDGFMRIPFGKYMNLSISINDGIDKCHNFMEKSKQTLDDCVFGLNDAKLQIMQLLGQWISNPQALGSAIAIKGPMGTGKTTLVKEGISQILGREFTLIALGGTGDSSFLEGHSYTYEGSNWGKIVQIIIDSKCMNPVIYFDELDKISDTPRGEEIIGILTHLTDTSQNNEFHDKYFSEVNFDLSKCLFIFSYNDESKINPILRDRMYCIQTKGYETKDKIIIARNHLLPKIQEQVRFRAEDIIIPDETIEYIITNTSLTHSEAGVRNLKRCFEIIYTKINLFRLLKPDTLLFHKDMDIKVEFPFTVSKKHVDILIKGEDGITQSMMAMYV
jgi:ATP-dependent Lon protease